MLIRRSQPVRDLSLAAPDQQQLYHSCLVPLLAGLVESLYSAAQQLKQPCLMQSSSSPLVTYYSLNIARQQQPHQTGQLPLHILKVKALNPQNKVQQEQHPTHRAAWPTLRCQLLP